MSLITKKFLLAQGLILQEFFNLRRSFMTNNVIVLSAYKFEKDKKKTILAKTGPNNWSSGPPESYEYIAAVKWLGDHTWIEVEDDK